MAKSKTASPARKSIFDTLDDSATDNLFCARANLSNEASVEQFFVNRLLAELGYKDAQIQPKKSIQELTVSFGGSKSGLYKPDYVLLHRKKPR